MPSFVVSLGLIPVQEWIAEARRSRDLRAGSVILSHLMARVLWRLTSERGCEVDIRVPQEREEGEHRSLSEDLAAALAHDYGIPNRASGFLTAPDSARIAEIFRGLGTEVVDRWQNIKTTHLERSKLGDDLHRALGADLPGYLEATVGGSDCPFSLVWVALPWSGEVQDRPRALEEVDRAYADVKRTRPVRGWVHGKPVGKCNQCGRREAVGPQESFFDWRRFHEELAQNPAVARGTLLRPGERLCAVCLAKRSVGYRNPTGERRKRFPSTGDVAIAPWSRAISRAGLGSWLDGIAATTLGREDLGRAVLESEEALWREHGASGNERLEELLAARRNLARAIDQHNRERPHETPLALTSPRYLAVLCFDGDDMGRHLQRDPEGAPRAMNDFGTRAGEALAQLGEGQAGVFYLGGDEGLAMVPVTVALELAITLRRAFDRAWEAAAEQPTLSMGIALFEYSRPMGGAIRLARSALEAAKARRDGGRKNALAIAVQTASGSRWRHIEPWGAGWERAQHAVDLVRSGRLAAGWPYDVERFLRSLEPDAWEEPGFAEAALDEVRRLFFRRLDTRGIPRKQRRTFSEARWNELEPAGWLGGRRRHLDSDWFHLVGFLARQTGPPVAPGDGETDQKAVA